MCFGGGGNTTTTVQQQSNIPQWANQAGQANYSVATALANRQYPTYQGPRIAGFTQPQQQSFQQVQNTVGNYQPNIDAATQAANRGSMATPDFDISKYMDPYQQNVVDATTAEIDRNSGMQNAALDRQIAGRKAFGSSGDLLKSEAMRNQSQVRANTVAGLMSDGFRNAQGAINADANRALQGSAALANIGGMQSQLGYRDASALQTIGAQQQDQTQRNYDLAYGDFQNEFNYPVQGLNQMMAALSGTPMPRDTTQTSTQPGASPFGQALGGAATLAGLGGPSGFGWWGKGSTGGPFGAW